MTAKDFVLNLKAPAREAGIRTIAMLTRLIGIECLTREQSAQFMRKHGLTYEPGVPTTLKVGGEIQKLEILPSGVVRVNGTKCLYLDYGNRSAIKNLRKSKKKFESVIAVWSHPWLGYYHYLTELVPKICRIQEIKGHALGGSQICYPFIHRKYETELQQMTGVPKDQFIDTGTIGGIEANEITFIPLYGWSGGNPNLDSLRKRFVQSDKKTGSQRLYLSRIGRRKCLQEDELIRRLKRLEFTIVGEPAPSVSDQMALFGNAAFIFGPHGGAFSNIVWAPRPCQVMEMVPTSYDVAYYRLLSEQCGLPYSRITCENGPPLTHGINVDFNVDVDWVMTEIENCLQA